MIENVCELDRCSNHQTTQLIATVQLMYFSFLLQVSYGDTNPILSDRKKYPNFYRTVPSDADFNLARIRLLQHYGWTRVGTLFQDASSRSARQANVIISFITEHMFSCRYLRKAKV